MRRIVLCATLAAAAVPSNVRAQPLSLTRLDDFKAQNAGTPTIEFAPERGGAPTVLRGSPPSRPGAFRVEGAPPAPGRYRWALAIDAPGVSDRHEFGVTTVFADEAAAKVKTDKRAPDDPAAIAYLAVSWLTHSLRSGRASDPVRGWGDSSRA
ncbi:MAG TPA: hypothetical protein VKE51_15690 [Vicinamibacterales bacterium]|nr:hypothetical protein [Vicinamibacterales bacterium]